MSQAKDKAAAGKKSAAARAEKKQQEATFEWKGEEFTVQLPISGTLVWDLAALQDADDELREVIRLIRSLVGDEQARKVRGLLGSVDELESDLSSFTDAALGAAGLGLGESSASASS